MTPLWTASEIAHATGGTLHGDFTATGVTFDSREIIGGELFIAMQGEAMDGHRFLASAIEREQCAIARDGIRWFAERFACLRERTMRQRRHRVDREKSLRIFRRRR